MRNASGMPAWCLLFKGLDGKWHRERTDAVTKDQADGLLRQRLSNQSEAKAKGLQNLEHLGYLGE